MKPEGWQRCLRNVLLSPRLIKHVNVSDLQLKWTFSLLIVRESVCVCTCVKVEMMGIRLPVCLPLFGTSFFSYIELGSIKNPALAAWKCINIKMKEQSLSSVLLIH